MSTVLIIDDEKLIVKATELVIRLSGYNVISSFDGVEGLKTAREKKPDLILLDIMMPGIDGWSVLKELKSDPATQQIPVIIFTAKEYIRGKESSLSAGAVDYITKPFETSELLQAIHKHISLTDKGVDK